MTTFQELGVDQAIVRSLKDMDIVVPTPIQEKIIPQLLEHPCDLISLAQTGSGKTAAFGLPLLMHADPEKPHPHALVLCPTRELCAQVAGDLTAYGKHIGGLRVLPLYGGTGIDKQISALRRGAQILVATPGRLIDLIERKKVHLSHIQRLVIDEADEMLQMGFQEEIDRILMSVPQEKNTFLFSATMPKKIEAIAEKYMRTPLRVTVGRRNAAADTVRHEAYTVTHRHRYSALKRILDNSPDNYSIVFCRTRRDTQNLATQLIEENYSAEALHGDLSQAQRDLVMDKFRARQITLLVATDVAARGLDVNNVSHVIHFSLPDDTANYTHRSGRTGRAGRSGVSAAIITPKELYRIKLLEKSIKQKFVHCAVPTGKEICHNQLHHLVEKVSKDKVVPSPADQLYAEAASLLADYEKEDLIHTFLSLHYNRFLNAYGNAPDINVRHKEDHKRHHAGTKQNQRQRPTGPQPQFTRFFLNVGRQDGVMPQRLIGTINEAPGGKKVKVGRIEIQRRSALLEADSNCIPQVLKAFRHVIINGKPVAIEVAPKQRRKKSSSGGKTGPRSNNLNPGRKS